MPAKKFKYWHPEIVYVWKSGADERLICSDEEADLPEGEIVGIYRRETIAEVNVTRSIDEVADQYYK